MIMRIVLWLAWAVVSALGLSLILHSVTAEAATGPELVWRSFFLCSGLVLFVSGADHLGLFWWRRCECSDGEA